MKTKVYLIVLISAVMILFSSTDLYSGRRGCTGDKNCTACSSCSGCKHCAKEGGTCGVCYTPPPKKKKEKPSLDTLNNDTLKTKKKSI